MLVILSDLHLSDGRGNTSLPPEAFDLFIDRLYDLAYRASWRSSDQYRPVEHIDLVLLGDTLDLTRSHRWQEGSTRPWLALDSSETVQTYETIVADILNYNRDGLARLRSLTAGGLSIPPVDRAGQPMLDRADEIVPVSIHMMVGECDWIFHVAGTSYDPLREQVIQGLGLACTKQTFAHEARDDEQLLELFRRYRVCARHGDIFDPISFNGSRSQSSPSDAILIDLIGGFRHELETLVGDELPASLVGQLPEMDHIRPLPLVAAWLELQLDRLCSCAALRSKIAQCWDHRVDRVLDQLLAQNQQAIGRDALVDALSAALRLRTRPSLGWVHRTLHDIGRLTGSPTPLHLNAAAESDYRNRRCRHVVYGHSHVAEQVPLEASSVGSYVLDQNYFNAGSWRRVYRATQWNDQRPEFLAAESMSYLAFYCADERAGRSYERWSGTLAPSYLDTGSHRLHPPQQRTVPRRVSSMPAPALGPHYAVQPSAVSPVADAVDLT